MASQEVTGQPRHEIEERRQAWNESHDREYSESHCLAKIPKQPEDYDGPVRFCTLHRDLSELGDTVRCKHHGGAGHGNPENMEKLAAMTHGMHAARDHLVEDFSEKDEALYDWVTGTFPDAYDIALEDDPQAKYDLHRLAAEIVRAERGRGFLIEEGEITEREIRDDEGRVVIDDTGEVVTEKSEHYLAQMMHRQDKKISDLEKELGITRKERLRHDQTDDAVDAIKTFAQLGGNFINRDDEEYDPGDEPWDDE